MLLSAIARASCRAASMCAGLCPGDDPQSIERNSLGNFFVTPCKKSCPQKEILSISRK